MGDHWISHKAHCTAFGSSPTCLKKYSSRTSLSLPTTSLSRGLSSTGCLALMPSAPSATSVALTLVKPLALSTTQNPGSHGAVHVGCSVASHSHKNISWSHSGPSQEPKANALTVDFL